MSRGNWDKIKRSKFFYVSAYRKAMTFTIAFQVVNVILCVAIAFCYLNKPERTFYATSGVTPPVQLTPLSAPNYSAQALLPPDPINDDENKVIPE